MRTIAQLYKALSEETRLEILALLFRNGELCVCDVEEVLEVSQSKASRHMRYLLNSGLVVDRRDGLWVRYRVVDDPSPDQHALLESARALLSDERAADVEARYRAWLERKSPQPMEPPAEACCVGPS